MVLPPWDTTTGTTPGAEVGSQWTSHLTALRPRRGPRRRDHRTEIAVFTFSVYEKSKPRRSCKFQSGSNPPKERPICLRAPEVINQRQVLTLRNGPFKAERGTNPGAGIFRNRVGPPRHISMTDGSALPWLGRFFDTRIGNLGHPKNEQRRPSGI
jgi:hypothetical protein